MAPVATYLVVRSVLLSRNQWTGQTHHHFEQSTVGAVTFASWNALSDAIVIF